MIDYLIIFIICFFLLCHVMQAQHYRWRVKTLQDTTISKNSFIPAVIEFKNLYSFDYYSAFNYKDVRLKDETIIYSLKCRLVKYKYENDGDIHLIVKSIFNDDSTIVCELPNPFCNKLKLGNSIDSLFYESRNYLGGLSYTKEGYWYILNDKFIYKITGFLFHDSRHKFCTGHMPNFLEIHPVIKIEKIY